jgi:hypothetical protein
MQRLKLTLLLLFLPSMVAELLSGNAPPARFFQPAWLLIFVLLYGCSCLLIREARVRWNLQWSILFLGVAYAIVEEGLTTKAFFNTNWRGTGSLAGYGMWVGVQWVWAIGVTFGHATGSILIPIAIAESLWPQLRQEAILKTWMLVLVSIAVATITLLGMLSIGTTEGDRTIPFHPHPTLLVGSVLSVACLGWLAYRFRNSRVETAAVPLLHPAWFFALAFLSQGFFLIVPNEMAKQGVPGGIAVLVELGAVLLILLFVFFELCHREAGMRHIASLILGFLMPYVLLAPVHEFVRTFASGRNKSGMTVVGIIALIALIAWRRLVLRRGA